MNPKKITLFIGCLLVLAACMNQNTTNNLQQDKRPPMELTKLAANGKLDQQPANNAKEILSEYEEIQGVRAVNNGEQLIIGIKLRHHHRLHMDDIERDLRKKIKKDFSDLTVTISTDEKIHLELQKLEKKLNHEKLSDAALKKRLNKIKKLSKEET